MIAPERSKDGQTRSGGLIGWGVRLALTGSILMVMYFFLVAQSPLQNLDDMLMLAVPAGVVCWILAVGLFAAGWVAWHAEEACTPDLSRARRELVREPAPETGSVLSEMASRFSVAVRKRFPAAFRLEWSLPLIRSLDRAGFRNLAASYFRELGFRPVTPVYSELSGIDIWLYGEDEERAVGAVQCLSWGSDLTGARQVREFAYMMAIGQIPNAVILSTGGFTEEARAFALGKKIELISGEDLMGKLAALPPEKAERLLRQL